MNSKGFTLIELLIVIAFIIVFASTFISQIREREYPCSKFKDYRQRYVPVRCLDYFNVETNKSY